MKRKTINQDYIEELFRPRQSNRELIYEYIKKHKRVTQALIAQELNIGSATAYKHLTRLTKEGKIKDLGKFIVHGREVRIYELS